MSKSNLKRALRIERKLTDSMKKLLDIGIEDSENQKQNFCV